MLFNGYTSLFHYLTIMCLCVCRDSVVTLCCGIAIEGLGGALAECVPQCSKIPKVNRNHWAIQFNSYTPPMDDQQGKFNPRA